MSPEFEIAVVGVGAVLPGAACVDEYWQRLMAGESMIAPLPAQRWSSSVYQAEGIPARERPPTRNAGFVAEGVLLRALVAAGIDADGSDRLTLMTRCAVAEALAGVDTGQVPAERRAILLGCMDVDEAALQMRFLDQELPILEQSVAAMAGGGDWAAALRQRLRDWDRPGEDSRATSAQPASILARLRRQWQLCGPAALIDAACASSLVAIAQSMELLRSRRIDLVVSGGIESNLGPDTYALFGCLGALAPERCLPLDRRSRGLSQGEGSVVFVLERMADARRLGHPVHALLRGAGVASDGGAASLFEPTSAGQLRALRRAYRGLDADSVQYVECHATGTPVGDTTEERTLRAFFGERDLPVGSVKALTGHTKGAAGAAGLLKCILSLRHRVLPPSPYAREPLASAPGPRLNRSPEPLPAADRLMLGVSAFGFGGINAHLVVEDERARKPEDFLLPDPALHQPALQDCALQNQAVEHDAMQQRDQGAGTCADSFPDDHATDADPVVVVSRIQRALEDIRDVDLPRIPPRSRGQIDALQLAAVVAAGEALAAAGLRPEQLDRDRIAVLAAATTGLDALYELGHRIRHGEAVSVAAGAGSAIAACVDAARARHAPVTEDTGPGVLNNVIAGRVANHFDFRGPAFAVDAEAVSAEVALWLAGVNLAASPGLLVLLAACEHWDDCSARVERNGIDCWLLASRAYAQEHALPIAAVLDVRFAGFAEAPTTVIHRSYSGGNAR